MKQISQLIKEIIPVIIGVLIALVINNWNEERKDKKYLTQIFSSINEEFKISEQYKFQCNMSIRELENRIKLEKLPQLDEERMGLENNFTQELVKFDNKVMADGMKLQETIMSEMNILNEELKMEE